MDALQDIRRRNAARNHVDHVGLREHGANAAHDLGIVALARKRSDLFLRDTEIPGDVLKELPRARCALARHLVAEDLAASIDLDRTAVQRADIERRTRFRVEVDGAARMGRHRVEMTGMERYAFSFARGRNIIDIYRA